MPEEKEREGLTARCTVAPCSSWAFRYASLVVEKSPGRAEYLLTHQCGERQASRELDYIPTSRRDGIGACEEGTGAGRAGPVAEVVPAGDAAGHAQTAIRAQDLAPVANARSLLFVEREAAWG